jgi:hypothetical protein
MEVELDGIGRLTTEHAASSYGQPVLVLDDESGAVGPGDLLWRERGIMPAGMLVRVWLREHGADLTDEERECAEGFAGMPLGQ